MPSCRAWRRVWTIIADVAPPLLDRQAAPRETAGDSCPVRHVAGKEVLFSGFRITAAIQPVPSAAAPSSRVPSGSATAPSTGAAPLKSHNSSRSRT